MPKAKKSKKKLPKFLQSALWSYDLNAFNLDNPYAKDIIVTQILNYGSWKQLRWLLDQYSKRDLITTLKKPRRGLWHKDSLDYWQQVLNIKLPKKTYQKALFNLFPQHDTLANLRFK